MRDRIHMFDQLIERIITDKKLEIRIILFGSFIYAEKYNDIDILLLYDKLEFYYVKACKLRISQELQRVYKVPIHFTTLTVDEYSGLDSSRFGVQYCTYDGIPILPINSIGSLSPQTSPQHLPIHYGQSCNPRADAQ